MERVCPSVKLQALREILSRLGGVLVAYSGGVDSTLVLKIALDVLGSENVLAVTVDTEAMTASEIEEAVEAGRNLGATHHLIDVRVLDDPALMLNPPNRCYLCKRMIFSRLVQIASECGYQVVDGSNADDLGAYRPGIQALRELGIVSPLAEAGLTKAEVRSLAHEMGLASWDMPSHPCLATRFPYGERLTEEKLTRVEAAEGYLRSLGFTVVRVRSHGTLARIEVPSDDVHRIVSDLAPLIVEKLKALGYTHVALDLEGYRMGSMDEALGRSGRP